MMYIDAFKKITIAEKLFYLSFPDLNLSSPEFF